jgi:DNA repair exonuclease SbcCD ATPase subunit
MARHQGGRQIISSGVKWGEIIQEGAKFGMDTREIEKQWQEKSAEVITGMAEWRMQHPKATLREIETELDERLARLRAKMLEEAAMLSEAREWEEKVAAPNCPDCGVELEGRTKGERSLQTQGGQTVRLERQYGICPQCGQGFFPPG